MFTGCALIFTPEVASGRAKLAKRMATARSGWRNLAFRLDEVLIILKAELRLLEG